MVNLDKADNFENTIKAVLKEFYGVEVLTNNKVSNTTNDDEDIELIEIER